MNVSTKVGRKFFKILDETIPPGHPLHKTFNRHTVKLSYSTMPNMLKKISVHNSRVTAKAQAEAGEVTSAPDDDIYKQEEEHCNCNGRMGPCPLDGNCRIERSCIYSCKVTRQDTQQTETYTGQAGNTFKDRYYGHNRSLSSKANKQTTLSNYVWELRDNNTPYQLKWTILDKAKKFNPITNKCRLCLKEMFYICYKPETASLNSRSEIYGWCKHRPQWTLQKTKS